MKKTKRTPTETIPLTLTRGQAKALCELSNAIGDQNDFTAAEKAFSIGLFVLGLDPSGDYPLAEVTDALFGKDSEDAASVFNAIVDTGDGSRDTMVNAGRARRKGRAA
jgi:hypothetical protein